MKAVSGCWWHRRLRLLDFLDWRLSSIPPASKHPDLKLVVDLGGEGCISRFELRLQASGWRVYGARRRIWGVGFRLEGVGLTNWGVCFALAANNFKCRIHISGFTRCAQGKNALTL